MAPNISNRPDGSGTPTNSYFGISDSQPKVTFPGVAKLLNRFNLAYLHVLESKPESGTALVAPVIRDAYHGTLIGNGGYDQESANDAIDSGEAEAIAFGTLFVANPDLVNRFRCNLPLNVADPKTFYTPGAAGYTDYPLHRIAA